MKKNWIIGIIVLVILVLIFALRFNPFNLSGEDSWIKDERGIYVKHGNPAETPDYVKEQQTTVSCAVSLYYRFRTMRIPFNSQCLGRCQDFAVDIVNVPRTSEDDNPGNQCGEYRNKIVSHFIELNKDGEIVRVV